MTRKRKLTPAQKAKLADKGFGLLDVVLKGMSKVKGRPQPRSGRLGGIRKPSPCGRCD